MDRADKNYRLCSCSTCRNSLVHVVRFNSSGDVMIESRIRNVLIEAHKKGWRARCKACLFYIVTAVGSIAVWEAAIGYTLHMDALSHKANQSTRHVIADAACFCRKSI